MSLSSKRLATIDKPQQANEAVQPAVRSSWLYAAILIYLLLFFGMRLANLTDFPLNVDERRHIIRAQLTLAEGDIFIGLRESLKQLYIWLVVLVLPFFRDHIFAARFAGVLTGLGAAAVCYKLGRSLFANRRIGWLAALFYLISPMALFYDRLAYTDTLLTMLMGAGILLSFQLWRTPTVKWAIALGIVFGLGGLAKAYAALYYPAPVLVWFLLGSHINRGRAAKLLAIVYGTTFILWLPIIIVGLNIFQEDHTQKLITDLPTETWLETVSGNVGATIEWVGGYLTLPFALLFVISLCWLIVRRNKAGLVLAILIGIHTVTFILLLRYGAARYLLPLLVPISVIVAWGVDQLARRVLSLFERSANKQFLSPAALWGVSMGLLLLLALPALRFDYLIVSDVAAAPLPGEDRWIFVKGRFSGYGLKESAGIVATMADQYPELIVLQGTNLMDTIFSLDVIGMSVYLQDKTNIVYKQIGDFGPHGLQTLDTYAQRAPTLTLGTFDEEGEPLPMFEPILNHPRAWRLASFPKPGQRHKVDLYQWLLWPDFAVRWLQQGGDPDPHIVLAPTEALVTANGGVLHAWPQTSDSLATALPQAGIEYVLLDADLVKRQPDSFAPFVAVDGSRLRFTQPPPDGWYLAFAYPDLACEWCLFYVRPPTHPATATFGHTIRLDGYDLPATTVQAGGVLQLTLYWQAVTPPAESLVAFAHLLDAQGQLVAQVDQRPLQGRWPTNTWQSGSQVADRYTLPLDPTLPAGEYTLLAGWYDPTTLVRLPVQSGELVVSDGAVELATVQVK